MKIDLRSRAIDGLPITGKRYNVRFNDHVASGLVLRIGVNGSKTWSFWQKIPKSSKIYTNTFGKVELDRFDRIKPSNVDSALAWATTQRTALQEGKGVRKTKRTAKGPMTTFELFDLYFNSHCKIKNRVSTQKNNLSLWRNHIEPEFGAIEITKIEFEDVDTFITQKTVQLKNRGGSGGRANNILTLLSAMMNFAFKRGWITTNPCMLVEKMKTNHDWPEISDNQRAKLVEESRRESEMMELIVLFALTTGARKQEILKARWEEFRDNCWTIPKHRKKSNKEHVIPLPANLLQLLLKWKNRQGTVDQSGHQSTIVRTTGFVFPSNAKKFDGKYNKKNDSIEKATPEYARPAIEDIKSPWTRIRKRAGLMHIRFHDLRHDFGTECAKNGISLYELMSAMGHSNIETTLRYIRKAPLDRQIALFALRENSLFG